LAVSEKSAHGYGYGYRKVTGPISAALVETGAFVTYRERERERER